MWRRGTDLDENDRRTDSQETIELDESIVLDLVIVAVHVHLFDALDSQVIVLKGELIGVGRKLVGVIDDGIGEGSGEQDDLSGRRKAPFWSVLNRNL